VTVATPNDRDAVAEQIARRIPLVHFPARLPLHDWANWPELTSPSTRGLSRGADVFARLRDTHVFTYAGPCCYGGGSQPPIGNAVLYLSPDAELGQSGEASAFDSGSLEDRPRLQPWAALPIDERWTFLRTHTRVLRDWRQHFRKWLAFCYDDPWRYLQSDEDLLLAGLPERSDPPEILDHNGPAGAHQYSGHCGDRRAWTWEVRFHQRLPWRAHVRLLHVTVAALERANDVADEIERMTGKRPDVRALPHDVMADFDAFFEASGPILRECIET